ncbi:MAG: GAF domain-containing protein [Nitrospirae bacterium]|nr:GAF domain-containing protein [Nitrospirota bacterium]
MKSVNIKGTDGVKVKCWQVLECIKKECPAYKTEDFKCWLISGTYCWGSIQGNCLDKIEICLKCDVLMLNLDTFSMRETLSVIDKQFKEYRKIVQKRDEEVEGIGLELAIGLSEVFEALRKISSGDPTVRISEKSKVDLISKLKQIVNSTAQEIGEIVNLSHEFAIVLAEHFDVLHRVAKGDLDARVMGKSKIELLESLKYVTNETIENISTEIRRRIKAEKALHESEKRYRTIFENTGTPTVIIQEDMIIFMSNKEFEKFSGYFKNEVEYKKSFLEFIIKDDINKFLEFAESLSTTKDHEPAYCELRAINRKGEIRDIIAVMSLIPGTKMKVASFVEITQRRYQEMEAIATLSTALRSSTTRTDMLPIIVGQIMELLRTDGVALAFRDPLLEEIVFEIARGKWSNWVGVRLRSDEGISSYVMGSGKPYLNNNIFEDERFARPELLGELQCVACVPLIAHGQTIGAIWIGRKSVIADYEVRLLYAISEIAANAINRITLYEQTEQRLQRLSALHAIDMAISSSLDIRVTLNVLLEHVITQLNTDAATVLLLNPFTQTLECAASRGFRSRSINKTRLRLGEGHAGRAALERCIISIPNVLKTDDPCVRSQILAGEVFIAHHAVPLIAKGQVKGVLEVFHRTQLVPDPEWFEFFEALAAQAAIAIDNADLFNKLQKSNLELTIAYDATIEGWSRALDMRDKETEGHTQRVTEMSVNLARALGVNENEILHIRRGALLHDIGKMGIPDNILHKSTPLNEEERRIMHQHPVFAYELLWPIIFLRPAINIPYCHHERWDGKGYPRGLKGEQIPFEARIFTVVDVWDALRSDRPYRKAWTEEDARNYIFHQAGKHFDPRIVEVFFKLIDRLI